MSYCTTHQVLTSEVYIGEERGLIAGQLSQLEPFVIHEDSVFAVPRQGVAVPYHPQLDAMLKRAAK